MPTNHFFIGLMSGTSVDAVDAVVARFEDHSRRPEIIATHSEPPPPDLRQDLLALSNPVHKLTLLELGRLDQAVGAWFARAATAVIAAAGLAPKQITAIGSHGQTIWHAPEDTLPFSMQIGSASRIAAMTGCPVISDFRNADMALGGQGAPLVCAFHAALFATSSQDRAVINIGGIANATLLPRESHKDIRLVRGFDTGPGNALMDAWIRQNQGVPHDDQGVWAASGTVDDNLLERLLDDPYFQQSPPKSTGREYFNLNWLQHRLEMLARPLPPADIQATLCELTAITITDAVARSHPGINSLFLCGGGVHNDYLVNRIKMHARPAEVETTSTLQISPDWLEALAFAWLARQRILARAGNAPGVTGASGQTVLGGWHLPPPQEALDPRQDPQ